MFSIWVVTLESRRKRNNSLPSAGKKEKNIIESTGIKGRTKLYGSKIQDKKTEDKSSGWVNLWSFVFITRIYKKTSVCVYVREIYLEFFNGRPTALRKLL